MLTQDHIIYTQIEKLTDIEIIQHDIQILQNQLEEQFQINYDLQDYIARWCHEVKIPLSALLLMNEKVMDKQLHDAIKEELEKIRQHLHMALIGCKAQSSIFDIQIKRCSLQECVTASIKNHQFFLIQKHFEITIKDIDDIIFTDQSWFVYVLDQIISNAIKYSEQHPNIIIWLEKDQQQRKLIIEDHGSGIKDRDLRSIFDRGYTGFNHHNGEYKSTGMGLYFAKKIIHMLGHEITVESEYGKYTRFIIILNDNREYFHMT